MMLHALAAFISEEGLSMKRETLDSLLFRIP